MMRPITSSMFSHIGYDADSMTLTVRYKKTGDVWVYKHYTRGIPEKKPDEGWGKWFNANVRGKYEGEKVEAPLTAEMLDVIQTEGRMPDSVNMTKSPVTTSVPPVMPENASVTRDPRAKMPDINDDNWGEGPIGVEV